MLDEFGETPIEVKKEAVHSVLDETKENHLSNEERVKRRMGMVEEMAKKDKKEWGMAMHIAVREHEKLGEGFGQVVIMGINESVVPGLNYTESDLLLHTTNIADWINLSQEERKEKLYKDILPNIKQVVEAANGWDGEAGVFGEYAALMFKAREEGSEEVDELAQLAVGMPIATDLAELDSNKNEPEKYMAKIRRKIVQMPEEVLFIAESAMGGMGGLNIENKHLLNENGIKTQKLELMRNIGWQISEAKMTEIEGMDWQNEKRVIAENLLRQFIDGTRPQDLDPGYQKQLEQLIEMLDMEEQVRSGRYTDNMWAVGIGHSMNGNIVASLMADVVQGRRTSETYRDFRKKTKERDGKKSADFRKRLGEAEAVALSDQVEFFPDELIDAEELDRKAFKKGMENKLGGITPADFLHTLRMSVADDMSLLNVSNMSAQSIKDMYPWLTFQNWMGVVYGNKAENLPEWALKVKEIAQLDTQNARLVKYHDLLSRDPLLGLINWIEVKFPGKPSELVRRASAEIIKFEVKRYIGKDVPEELADIYTQHLIKEGAKAQNDSRILATMEPSFSKEIIPAFTKEMLERYGMFVGTEDTTLMYQFMKAMRVVFAATYEQGRNKIIHELPGTGHHPQIKDMDTITADMVSKLVWHDERVEERKSQKQANVKIKLAAQMAK